jgi:hypothetical protein
MQRQKYTLKCLKAEDGIMGSHQLQRNTNEKLSNPSASWTLFASSLPLYRYNFPVHFFHFKYQNNTFIHKKGRVFGITEACNWCEKVPKIMRRSLSLLYVQAHTFILQRLSPAFLSLSTSHFPQATPSSLHLAFPIIKFPSPEMKLPVHGLSQGRRGHEHTYSYKHTFLPAAAPSSKARSRGHL